MEREPICGHCWAEGVRVAQDFKTERGYWECPRCLARTVTPGPDEEELRALTAKLTEDYRHTSLPVNTIIARDHFATLRSTRRLRPGRNSKSKRKRPRKPVPRPRFPLDSK